MKQAKWLTLGFLVALGMGCGSDETVDPCAADGGLCESGETGGTDEATGGSETPDATGGTPAATGGNDEPMATGGEMPDPVGDDAGMDPVDSGMDDAGMDPVDEPEEPMDVVIKQDGSELAGCNDDRDCNQGLGCVPSAIEDRGYCSTPCTEDTECTAFGDAGSCSSSLNLCIQRCEGPEDTSCMGGMTCQARDGLPGFQSFMCQYPAPPPPPVILPKAWEECSAFGPECEGDTLSCDSTVSYCTPSCTLDSECTAPATGSIAPSCQSAGSGADICVLDCSENEDGCPDGMTCQRNGFPGSGGAARCVF